MGSASARRCFALALLGWFLTGLAGAQGPAAPAASHTLIREALDLFAAPAPPDPMRSERPVQSATILLNEIKSLADKIEPAALQEVADLLERPGDLTQDLATPHFRIHYAAEGADAPASGLPQSAGEICEQLWDFYHLQHGWPAPLNDGDAGGDARIDVYLQDLGWGVYAYALHEDVAERGGKTGFIVLENDFAGFTALPPQEALRVSLAHEFFHLIQFSYGYDPASNWFMEQHATMMEGLACPDIHDHDRYLTALAGNPHRRLDLCNGAFEYGAWLWPQFLYERWGEPLLQEIWETWSLGDRTLLDALDEALRAQDASVTLDGAYAEWALWNLFLGDTDDGSHYAAGADYPVQMACEASLRTYPVADWAPPARRQPEPLGANYIELRPDPVSADNRLTLTLRAGASLGPVVFVGWRMDGGAPLVEPLAIEDGVATISLDEWDAYECARLVITQGAAATTSCAYVLNANTRFASAGIEDETALPARIELAGCPNPFEPYTTITYNLPEGMKVALRIYDAQGRLVESLFDGRRSAGMHAVRWQGPADGREPEAGVYFCEIRTPHGTQRLRLVRIR